METAAADEGELLTLARTGDEGAFNALVESHRAELRFYCYRMLGSIQDAVQNAMLRAWRGLGAFEGRSSVRSWLYTIATNTTLDALGTGDVDVLLAMLTEDATWCMPPWTAWFQGHEALRSWLTRDPLTQRWRPAATRANGQLAVGCYLYSHTTAAYEPAVIDVLTLSAADGKISAVTAFVLLDEQVDPAEVFARFGLPATPPAS
jgi:RNA polymerase sigma factor (sigma-70 family)